MRSKSPLALMEQLVMVLVFALAAALCLQAFALADRMSERNEAVDRAVMECQNAAELMKAAGGDMAHAQQAASERMGGGLSQGLWQVLYDEDWNVVSGWEDCVYRLEAQGLPVSVEGLCKAHVQIVREEDGQPLFELNVAWQEVDGNG